MTAATNALAQSTTVMLAVALTTVMLAVDPGTNPNGCLVPSMSMPNAATQTCSAKHTTSVISATRSSPENRPG